MLRGYPHMDKDVVETIKDAVDVFEDEGSAENGGSDRNLEEHESWL
jgi:hypothetical protein